MSSLQKKNYMKRDFVAGDYLSEAPSPPMTPYPPHTVHILREWGMGGGS